MPPRVKPLARLADNLLAGTLAAFIDTRRDEGKSWDTIAKDLWAATDHEIDVTGVTITNWAVSLGIDTRPRQQAAS